MSLNTTETHDFVIVGSGINSLVCAALLARDGKSVVVLERNDRLGGCIRTEELFPGFTHDILSSSYPLFVSSPAYEELGDELHAAGLEFANTPHPTAVLTEDGESLIMAMDPAENHRRFEEAGVGDGDTFGRSLDEFFSQNANLAFGLLGNELFSRQTYRLLFAETRKRKVSGMVSFLGESLESCRTWTERDFSSDLVRAIIAPWVLHAGLGPDDAYSGLMGKIIMGAVGMVGMPVVVGGSQRIVAAFSKVITGNGGALVTGADVSHVMVEGGTARGVITDDGRTYTAKLAVICNVTPTQLYGRLLTDVPVDIAVKATDYRYGRADMQLHYALETPPAWPSADLADVAYVHLTPGLDGVSKAVNEAERGLLPETGTIVVGQPAAIDPSRAPEGKSILWIQLQELPAVIRGDAAGEMSAPADGLWNDEIKHRYIERIEERLERHIPGFRSTVIGRRGFSPSELEGLNVNLVGGDPYSGACTIDQFLAWRPFPGARNHETYIDHLFHIGASTHPGPGLGGISGYMVASNFI